MVSRWLYRLAGSLLNVETTGESEGPEVKAEGTVMCEIKLVWSAEGVRRCQPETAEQFGQ